MAVDVETLLVRLEASQNKFEKQMRASYQTADRRSNQIERRFQRMNKTIARSTLQTTTTLNRGLSAIGLGLGVTQVAAFADAWTNAENKIRAAADAAGVQARSLNELNSGANDARAELSAYVDLYARLIRSASAVAKSEQEIADATNIVSKAFKAGGASASEQASGILQLGQALGSGVLQGDELRSLRENAPILAQAIADEFKTTIAGLKDLGAEGALTADRVFRAIINAQSDIEGQFQKTNSTISDAITRINNEFTAYIGNANNASGASAALVEALQYLADNFADVADTVTAFIAVLAGAFAGKAIAGITVGIGKATIALGAFLTSVATGKLVLASFTALLGPIGLLLGGAAAAMYLYNRAHQDAGGAVGEHSKAIELLTGKLSDGSQASKTAKAEILKEAEAHLKAAEATLINARAKLALREENAKSFKHSAPKGFFVGQGDVLGLPKSDVPDVLGNGFETSLINAASEAADAQKDFDGALEAIKKLRTALGETSTTSDEEKPSGFGGGIPTSTSNSKSAKKLETSLENARQRIAAIKAETAVQSKLNPLVNDYGLAVEKVRFQQDLLQQVQKSGVELTPKLSATIEQLSNEYANATVEAARLEEAQQKTVRNAEEMRDLGKETLSGFINDLRNGVSATDALANALDRVADKLLDMALDNLFSPTKSGGNLLSSLFSGFFGGGSVGAPMELIPHAKGGIAAHGKSLPLFAKGGISNSAAIFGEAGPEAAVPLPDGRRIPVDLRGGGNSSPLDIMINVTSDDEKFSAYVGQMIMDGIRVAAPDITDQAVGKARSSFASGGFDAAAASRFSLSSQARRR